MTCATSRCDTRASKRDMTMKVYNFNPGPAVLPQPVLEHVQQELLDYQGRGLSILEISHRSKEYEAINAETKAQLKQLLGLDDRYRVLFQTMADLQNRQPTPLIIQQLLLNVL